MIFSRRRVAGRQQPDAHPGDVARRVRPPRRRHARPQPRPVAPRVADDRLRARRARVRPTGSTTSTPRTWRSTATGLYEHGVLSAGMGWQVPRLPGLGEVRWDRFIAALVPGRLRLRRRRRARGPPASRAPTRRSRPASSSPATPSPPTSSDRRPAGVTRRGRRTRRSAGSLRISLRRPSGRCSSLITTRPSSARAALGDPRRRAVAPVELDRLPLPARRRPEAGVHHGVDDVAVVERLDRLAALVDGVEHVGEHVDVAELADLVADREQPAALGLGLLGDVARRRRRW